jgi:ligand-binding sensor domain-containing protein
MAQMNSRRWPVLLAAVSALAVNLLAAANDAEWSARIWRLDDGLPDDNVTGVIQTFDGYLWVATDSGLARFDGVRFQNIALPIPSGRSRPLIRAMLLERGNRVWLALEGGVVVSLSQEGTNVFTTTNGLSWVRPTSIVQDQKRDVWIGYADGSACRIAKGRVTRFAGGNAPAGSAPCMLERDIKGQVCWHG